MNSCLPAINALWIILIGSLHVNGPFEEKKTPQKTQDLLLENVGQLES